MNTPKDKALSKAKIALLSKKDATFISTIVMALKSSWDNSIPTACTNGIDLLLNEDFYMKQGPLEQVGLLAHEAWHIALQHVLKDRQRGRDPRLFNQAADHVINIMLTDAGYRIPAGGLCDTAYRGMSTEQVYDILEKDPSKQDPNFEPDYTFADASPDPAVQQAAQAAVTQTIVRAATAAKLAGDSSGSVPGDVLIALDKLLYPKLPWWVLLQDFFNGIAQEDYSYRKPNKRFMPAFYMPSLFSEGMGELACAVDTSGSVSDHDFLAFATEMDAIKESMNPEKMYVIDFDTQVNSIYQIGEGRSVHELQFKGRGGTDLRPVFEHFKEKPPQVLIIFSDLECGEITEDPGYPVLWIRTPGSGFTPTFGRLIEFNPN